jgi:hypothetical protein
MDERLNPQGGQAVAADEATGGSAAKDAFADQLKQQGLLPLVQ